MNGSKPCMDPAIRAFLALVSRANAVALLRTPTLASRSTSKAFGDPDNQVLALRWEDQESVYGFQLTEQGISSGLWHADEGAGARRPGLVAGCTPFAQRQVQLGLGACAVRQRVD